MQADGGCRRKCAVAARIVAASAAVDRHEENGSGPQAGFSRKVRLRRRAVGGRNGVELQGGDSGSFTIKVKASNIAGDGLPGDANPLDQDFALVLYNGSGSPLPVISAGATAITADAFTGRSRRRSERHLEPVRGRRRECRRRFAQRPESRAGELDARLRAIGRIFGNGFDPPPLQRLFRYRGSRIPVAGVSRTPVPPRLRHRAPAACPAMWDLRARAIRCRVRSRPGRSRCGS